MELPEIVKKAEKYASQGFDEYSICDLLQVDGCSSELSMKIAMDVINDLPEKFATDTFPRSFEDVKDSVRNAVLTASEEDLDEYFDNYTGEIHKGIKNRILLARDSGGIFVSEVVQELEPLIDDLIVTNIALSSDKKVINAVDDKERLELRLFGIWPAYLIRERENIDVGDKKIISKSKVIPGKNSLI